MCTCVIKLLWVWVNEETLAPEWPLGPSQHERWGPDRQICTCKICDKATGGIPAVHSMAIVILTKTMIVCHLHCKLDTCMTLGQLLLVVC